MITKPEDAIPDRIEIAIITDQECIDKGRQAPLFFTVAKSAEIARAYAACSEDEAIQGCNTGEGNAWRKLFAEWEGK